MASEAFFKEVHPLFYGQKWGDHKHVKGRCEQTRACHPARSCETMSRNTDRDTWSMYMSSASLYTSLEAQIDTWEELEVLNKRQE